MPIKATFLDRLRAACAAFKQRTKPDPDAMKTFLARRNAEFAAAVAKLPRAQDREFVMNMLKGPIDNELATAFIGIIRDLPVPDQMALVKRVVHGNSDLVLLRALSGWATRHASWMAAQFRNRPIT